MQIVIKSDDGQEYLTLTTSALPNEKYALTYLFERFIEVALCKERAISIADIQTFEDSFAKMKAEYPELVGPNEKAHDNIRAPHFAEHMVAHRLKTFIGQELGINFESYEEEVGRFAV